MTVPLRNLDEPVMRHARTDIVAIPARHTVQEVLDDIRIRPAATGSFFYLYVIDDDRRLAGVIQTRRLLTAPLDAHADSIMARNVIAIPETCTLLDACEFFVLHKFLAFPVVDADRRLLGVIDIGTFTEEMFDIEEREQVQNLFETLGVSLSEIRSPTAWSAFRYRFPWLLATIASGTVCALLAGLFEATLAQSLILAFFLTLVLGLGESIAFPGSSKIFAAEVPAAHRGTANAVVAAALAFGPAVGTLAGGMILQAAGWRPIFWTFGAITLLWLVPWQVTSAPLRARSVATPVTAPVNFAALLKVPALWQMGAAHFMSNYGFYFLLTWLPLYLVKTVGWSIPQMTLLTTLGFAVQGVTALVSGRWSDRAVAMGAAEGPLRRRAMIWAQALSGGAIAALWFADGLLQVGLCLVIAGIGSGLLATNLYAVGQMFSGPRAAGSWIGVQNACGNCAGIIGPVVTGVIVDRLGSYGWAFALAAGVSLLGTVWWWKTVPEIRQADLSA